MAFFTQPKISIHEGVNTAHIYDLVIIGGGPAGVSAASYADQRGMSTLLLEEAMIGNNLYSLPSLEDYPFCCSEINNGESLAKHLTRFLATLHTEVVYEKVVKLEDLGQKVKKIHTAR